MKEVAEFRIPERNAAQYLLDTVGERLSSDVRKVTVSVDDPLFAEIGRLHRVFRERNEYFFLGHDAKRTYAKNELLAAQLFHVRPRRIFEPAGEECGTRYDDSTACPLCGAAATQLSAIQLDLRRVPRTDFAETIAGERIVSQRLAECMTDAGLKGFELARVLDWARHEDDAFDLTEVPTGRQILRNAERAGAPHPNWSFWVWANRAENQPLFNQARAEQAAKSRRADRRRRRPSPVWHQLKVTAPPMQLSPLTRAGDDVFDFEGTGKCPLGHVIGLNLLSEVVVTNTSVPEADVMETHQMIGVRRGLLRPRPILCFSPKARKVIEDQKIKGIDCEVAHIL